MTNSKKTKLSILKQKLSSILALALASSVMLCAVSCGDDEETTDKKSKNKGNSSSSKMSDIDDLNGFDNFDDIDNIGDIGDVSDIDIACRLGGGDLHRAFITNSGELYLWGGRNLGEIGNGGMSGGLSPEKILDDVICVNLASTSSSAVTANGELYTWGQNKAGQLGTGNTKDAVSPQKILDNVKYAELNTGYSHLFKPGGWGAAITKDNELYVWGSNCEYGNLGIGTLNDSFTPQKIMDDVKTVRLASTYGAAITNSNELYMWGAVIGSEDSNSCNFSPVKIMDNVKSISLHGSYCAAITESGELYTWGFNNRGQLGIGTEDSKDTPVKILDNVECVSLHDFMTAAVTTSGELYVWGCGGYTHPDYFLGDGKEETSLVPVKIMDNVRYVDLWDYAGIILTKDDELWTWGRSDMIGDGGTNGDRLVPAKTMDNIQYAKGYGSGFEQTISAVTNDGELYMWGYNKYHQLGASVGDISYTPIKVTFPDSSN